MIEIIEVAWGLMRCVDVDGVTMVQGFSRLRDLGWCWSCNLTAIGRSSPRPQNLNACRQEDADEYHNAIDTSSLFTVAQWFPSHLVFHSDDHV
jgi:hypothetical protein